jgi:hypothetical protein
VTAPDRAAIMIATPARPDMPDYRVVLFHDDIAEISPRLPYAAARAWVAARGAPPIALDEHTNQAELSNALDQAAEQRNKRDCETSKPSGAEQQTDGDHASI